jgi:hypothetical protein
MINGGLSGIKLVNECLVKLRLGLIDSINKRFKYVFDNNLFIASTFMNYKFKKFEFVSNIDERANLISIAKHYIIDLHKLKFNNDTANILSSNSHIVTTPASSLAATQTQLLVDISNNPLINQNRKKKLIKVIP